MPAVKSLARYLFVFVFLIFSVFAFSQTIYVYDGSGTGTDDVDWWSSSDTFSAHWTDNIDWAKKSSPFFFRCKLQKEIAPGDFSDVKTIDVPVPDSGSTPPYSITFTGITLDNAANYRVRVEAYGDGGLLLIDAGNSDGATTDFSPPSVSITSQYSHSTNSYTVSWSGTDSGIGVDSYDVQYYNVDVGTWTSWLTATTNTQGTFQAPDSSTYNFRVRARDTLGNVSDWSYSDTDPPTATMNPIGTVTQNTFTVQWSGSDPTPGGSIIGYDVQYSVNNGSWQDLLTFTTDTSYQFTGNNGYTYGFRVRAYDAAGNKSDWTQSAAQASATINVLSPSVSLSTSPASLSFTANETEKNLDIVIRATGGNVTITSVTENRNYPSWGTDNGMPENLSVSIAGGGSYHLQRNVQLESIARTRALGTGTEGTFTVTYKFQGQDNNGNPVTGSISIPVTVSGGLPSSFSINSVNIELPPSPYYVGDVVENPRVTINASGSGTVSGQVLVDDDTSWSTQPSFTVNVDGTTSFDINGSLPTNSPGDHTVKVEITDPVQVSSEETYTVSSTTPPFPPQTLVLVKDVAELTDLDGTANAISGEHYTEFHFTGTAKMKIFPLKDDNGNPTVLSDVTVNELVVRYDDDKPTKAKIRGGTVEKEVTGDEVIATIGNGYLRVKKVSFTGQVSPPTDYLRIDTKLYIPKLGMELFKVGNLILKTEGIEAKAVSISDSDAKVFNAFGMEFRIHDVDAEQAIVVGKDKENDRYYITLSGGIKMSEKSGTTKTKKEITTFKGLTFYTDGDVDGTITFKKSFDIIPDTLTLNKIKIQSEGDSFKMKLAGELKNLPYPLDSLGTTNFEFKFDKDGNAEGYVVPVHELKKNNQGHGLGGNDETEWDLGIAQVDLTYLALYLVFNEGDFDKDHSEIQIGVDFYLDLKNQDGSQPSEDEKRISFGELNANEDFTGGVTISMDGDVTWHQPTNATLISNKRLDLAALSILIDGLAVAPDPFRIIFTGGILVDLSGVSGQVNFENLAIGLDGSVSNLSDAIQGGMLDVVDAVHVEVDDVDWSGSPTTLTFNADATTGEGENRAPQKSTKSVDVKSYLRFMGASVSVGSSDDPVMNGGFDELTFYQLQNGSYGMVLRNATLSTSGVDIRADIEYESALLRVAGEVDLPNEISAVAVGKIGSQNGVPTMGIFIAASGLSVAVGPGVFLNEIGGGVFINPVQEDVELVRHIARFERPELSDEITSKRPGGAENPGAFAIMLLGGVYVSAPDFVSGRALVTITANYFNLDAEVECLDGLLEGTAYLAIGWNPAYGEGNVVVNMDYVSIIEGQGNLEFYVYSKDLWGVSGEFNISLLGQDVSSGSLFVGPPGFMLEASVSMGIDYKIISGTLTYSGMFWYYKVPDPDTWGAYVKVAAEGDFLEGLFSAAASLEGALIGSPVFVIYAVGSIRVKVCYVTVFNGSLWISVGENGFHGGKGRNAKYDGIIEEARNMADAMNEAKDQLTEAMNDAKLELARLNEAQREAAGLALVERSGILGGLITVAFQYNELNRWGPEGLPQGLRVIYERIYGPGQQNLVEARTRLQQLMNRINRDISNLESLQQDIAARIDQYEDLLVEDLPSVQDIGNLRNPFKGIDEKTVNVGGVSKTVQSGFRIDEAEAESQQDRFTSVREDFAKYQDAFMEEAGKIDAKLQQLDELLFQSDKSLSELARRYGTVYTEMGNYINDFVAFQGKNYKFADESLNIIQSQVSENEVRQELQTKAQGLTENTLNSWNNDRIQLIQALISVGSTGGEQPETYNPPTDVSPSGLFIETGVELWWNIPIAGFTKSKSLSLERRQQAIASFKESAQAFRQKWASTTNLIDSIYERKSALYDIIYEIYDELAEYGTGMIGVDATGNVSGIAGLAGTGLSFRTGEVAGTVLRDGQTLPQGTKIPDTPTIGPLRPVAPVGPTGPGVPAVKGKQFGGKVMMNIEPYGDEGDKVSDKTGSKVPEASRLVFNGTGATGTIQVPSTPGITTPGVSGSSSGNTQGNFAGVAGIGATIKLEDSLLGLIGDARIIRDPYKLKQKKTPTIWIPITSYFAGKRAEIEPYLEVPSVESFSGTVTSRNEFTALLTASFSGSHPVGVVEYEYKVEPAGSSGGTSGGASGGGGSTSGSEGASQENTGTTGNTGGNSGSSGGIPGMLQFNLVSIPIFIPWFTLGDLTSLTEPFFPDINKAGDYYLYIKVRGAGGKSIVRRATVNLRYFNPATDNTPVSSSLDTSDKTPPSKPVVTLEGPFTYRTDKIYARWSSEDLESGIQSYQYAVGTYASKKGLVTGGANVAASGTVSGIAGTIGSGMQPGTLETLGGYTETAQSPQVPTDVLGWHNAGGRKEANIIGLNLEHGKSYVVSVKATNGVGKISIGTSDPILVDTTAPVGLSINSLTQVKADNHGNSISFRFTPATDPESGIASHSFAVGTSEGADDLVEWRETTANKATVVNIPLPQGSDVYVTVKAENGAGLETRVSRSISLSYSDSTPPQQPVPVSISGNFTSDTSKLSLGWNRVEDPESGIVEYSYGIGTTPYYPDVLPWSSVVLKEKPYILGQGTEGTVELGKQRSGPIGSRSESGFVGGAGNLAGSGATPKKKVAGTVASLDYSVDLDTLHLSGGTTYYILVKAKNGAGLESTGASTPVVVDTTPPVDTSLTAPEYSTSRDYLEVTIRARDNESGIKAYRFAVWDVEETSYNENTGGDNNFAIPVSGGFTAPGVFGGSQEIQGMEVPSEIVPQAKEQGGQAPGGGKFQTPKAGEMPPWVQDVDVWGPPWFESDWQEVSSGALPEDINLTVRITGFPKGLGAFLGGHSLRYGKKYRVKVWVKNGAGLEKAVGTVTINIVRELPGKKGGSSNNVPQKSNRL